MELPRKFRTLTPVHDPAAINASCIEMLNAQYSFYDSQSQSLYTISTPNVAQFDVSSRAAVLVKLFPLENSQEFYQGLVFNQNKRVLYALNGTNLLQFDIDTWVPSFLGKIGNYAMSYACMSLMDVTLRFYILLNPEGDNM